MNPGFTSRQAAYDAAEPDNTDACEPCQGNDCPATTAPTSDRKTMNSHFETATTYMGAVTIAADDAEDRRLTMDAAQIEATLALAYEQARAAEAAETANLIAYLNLAMADRSGRVALAYSVPLETLKSMQAQIDERLGLA